MIPSEPGNRLPGLVPAWDFAESGREPSAPGWVVAEPHGPVTATGGELVLGMAADVRSAVRWLTEVAEGAAGLVLRHPGPAAARRLAARAQELAVPLYWLDEDTPWSDLIAGISDGPRTSTVVADDGLASLAQTLAVLTDGLVVIEDLQSRVLAYSSSSDDVDDLRRLSILGRSGPPEYLQLLQDWGVYDRLSVPEQVVEVAEHPGSGIRRRLAIGVFAGTRPLGTIWLQQQSGLPLRPEADQALRGAARLVAEYLVDGAREGRATVRPETDVLRRILARQADAAATLGRSARSACVVLAFAPGTAGDSPAAHRLALRQVADLAAVQAASVRAGAIVEVIGNRVYVLLPAFGDPDEALRVVSAVTRAGREHGHPTLRGAAGPVAADVTRAATSRAGADLALDQTGDIAAAGWTAVRPHLVVDRAVAAVDSELLADPDVATLVSRHSEIGRTLLDYLDRGSDVTATADALGVHATTIRYRLRRAQAVTGLVLGDPERQLALHLQLRAAFAPHRESQSTQDS